MRRADPGYTHHGARGHRHQRSSREREHRDVGRVPAVVRRRRRDPPGRLLPQAPPARRRGDRRGAARPARPHPAHHRGVVDGARPTSLAEAGLADAPTCPAPRTPPSTARSGCCRCSPPATAGTSAASRPRCTPTPGVLTVFVHDGHPGGAGFAERGFRAARAWLTATREAIAACECARAARRASSRPSAATATTRSTRPARSAARRAARRGDAPTAGRRSSLRAMVILGLVLIAVGARWSSSRPSSPPRSTRRRPSRSSASRSARSALFLLGVGAGRGRAVGLSVLKFGAKRELAAAPGAEAARRARPRSSTSRGRARAGDRRRRRATRTAAALLSVTGVAGPARASPRTGRRPGRASAGRRRRPDADVAARRPRTG